MDETSGDGDRASAHEPSPPDRRTLAAALAVSEARLALALEAARMFTFDYELDTGKMTWSGTARSIVGLPDDAPLDLATLAARIHPDDLGAVEDEVRALIAGATPRSFEIEYRITGDGGRPRWFRSTGRVSPELGAGRVSGATQDVTDHRRLEDALLRARKLEGIGRLAGGVAHDFNNLITAILTAVTFIEGGRGDLKEDLGIIRTAAERAGSLVQQLQRVAGKQRLEIGVLDLNDVVLDLETVLHRLCGEDCRLVLDLEPTLRPVNGDRGALGQVFIQVVANAAEALAHGGVIQIATSNCNDGWVELAVADDGVGFDEAARQHLFEPFFSTKQGGLGLGLASSYGIVQQHGGHIGLASEESRGTRIALRLPRAVVATEVAPPPTTGTRETILLVEDDELVRRSVVRGLAELGYDLLVAADGEEALDLAAGHPGAIDVVVSDLVMPGMNGVVLAERLAESRPDTPTIFVSGHTLDRIERRAGVGADVLTKPYSVESLNAKIRDVVKRGRPDG